MIHSLINDWSNLRLDYDIMQNEIERDFGVQPIAKIMEAEGLTAKDLVKSSKVLITHKMVSRACKGRRLSSNVRMKILHALEAAAGKEYKLGELFTYIKPKKWALHTKDEKDSEVIPILVPVGVPASVYLTE